MITTWKPKNKRWLVALLAGGPQDIGNEISTRLADRRGIQIKYHWDYEHTNKFRAPVMPVDVDVVIILKDMI